MIIMVEMGHIISRTNNQPNSSGQVTVEWPGHIVRRHPPTRPIESGASVNMSLELFVVVVIPWTWLVVHPMSLAAGQSELKIRF